MRTPNGQLEDVTQNTKRCCQKYTFSHYKTCSVGPGMRQRVRRFTVTAQPDASLIGAVRPLGVRQAPPLRVYRDAVTTDEEAALVADADRFFKRKAFEEGHFDNVIVGYREMQKSLSSFSDTSRTALQRLTAAIFPADCTLQPAHLLDLAPTGFIRRHVDHIEYSGAYIVGLSLLSDAVMTLHWEKDQEQQVWLPLWLPRRSLYVLHGEARYEWAHAIPRDAAEWWPADSRAAVPVRTGRRLAVIFRDLPPDKQSGTAGNA